MRSLGRKERKGKALSDDRQLLHGIQNNFLLSKRNTLSRSRWKCNFGAVDNGSVSDMRYPKRTGASVGLFCRHCVTAERGCRTGRALTMGGAVSLQGNYKENPLWCFELGKRIKTAGERWL